MGVAPTLRTRLSGEPMTAAVVERGMVGKPEDALKAEGDVAQRNEALDAGNSVLFALVSRSRRCFRRLTRAEPG